MHTMQQRSYAASTGQTECTAALPGQYVINSDAPQQTFSVCAAGSYTDKPGMDKCIEVTKGYKADGVTGQTPCNNGGYQPSVRSTACLITPKGTHTPPIGTHQAPIPCGLGEYADTEGAASCITAPKGYRAANDRKSKVACSGGFYQDEAGQDACKRCPAGTLSPVGAGVESCTAVKASDGEYTPVGAAVPSIVDEGYYSIVIDQMPCDGGKYQPSPAQASCLDANLGRYVPQDGLAHDAELECEAGTISNNTGLSACIPCHSGSYQSAKGQTACTVAEVGYYVPIDTSGHPSQTACPAGTFSNSTGQTACYTAEPGYRSTGTDQVPCDDGTYQPEAGQTTCVQCVAGYYVPDDGKAHKTQIKCTAGTYTTIGGLNECTAATEGYRSTGTGQVKCNNGQYQPDAGKDVCIDAAAGYIVADDDQPHTEQVICPVGSVSTAKAAACTNCYNGKYQPTAGQGACLVASQGHAVEAIDAPHSSQTACLPGWFTTSEGSASCTEAIAGTRSTGTSMVNCDDGTYQPQPGKTECITADAGYFVPADNKPRIAQEDCLAGTFCCSGGNYKCYLCNDGKYQPDANKNTCIDADVGFFVPDDGQAHTTQTACDVGWVAPATRSNKCRMARAGYRTDGVQEYPCVGADGKYQPEPGQDVCRTSDINHFVKPEDTAATTQHRCIYGFLSPAGSTSCMAVDVGYRWDASGVQVPCTNGVYQSILATGACLVPYPGYVTLTTGNPQVENMLCDPTILMPNANRTACVDRDYSAG